ncbi:hypothetical protein [Streptomyces orinoci]|uniref:Uncharacterized protein n=1 Tax=Streptomyces orinoci TaxID=67339 RepID=A0ABV3JV93_STRON|nr:hypothetical protein [Streptomyces orinoci]
MAEKLITGASEVGPDGHHFWHTGALRGSSGARVHNGDRYLVSAGAVGDSLSSDVLSCVMHSKH